MLMEKSHRETFIALLLIGTALVSLIGIAAALLPEDIILKSFKPRDF